MTHDKPPERPDPKLWRGYLLRQQTLVMKASDTIGPEDAYKAVAPGVMAMARQMYPAQAAELCAAMAPGGIA